MESHPQNPEFRNNPENFYVESEDSHRFSRIKFLSVKL